LLLRLGLNVCGCLLTGRKYIGIELDAEYFNQASARLARVKESVAAKRLPPSFPRCVDDEYVPPLSLASTINVYRSE
jgi:predicted alpha/beta hydrolase